MPYKSPSRPCTAWWVSPSSEFLWVRVHTQNKELNNHGSTWQGRQSHRTWRGRDCACGQRSPLTDRQEKDKPLRLLSAKQRHCQGQGHQQGRAGARGQGSGTGRGGPPSLGPALAVTAPTVPQGPTLSLTRELLSETPGHSPTGTARTRAEENGSLGTRERRADEAALSPAAVLTHGHTSVASNQTLVLSWSWRLGSKDEVSGATLAEGSGRALLACHSPGSQAPRRSLARKRGLRFKCRLPKVCVNVQTSLFLAGHKAQA